VKINYLAACFCSIFIFFAACTKITSTDIGTGLIPAVDSVITKDTFITVYAKNAGDTTIAPVLSQTHVVGYVNDPLFGSTNALINFQVSLPSSKFQFVTNADNVELDSVVLVLSYNGAWGDTNIVNPLRLNVKEIKSDQSFVADSLLDAYGYLANYDNKTQFATYDNPLTASPAIIYPTNLDNMVHVFEDSGVNMIRIRLNDDFGKRLLFNYDTTNAYKSDSAFKTYLKGLQVYADTNAGSNSLLKIGLADENTKLAVYYNYHPEDSSSAVRDTSVKYFTVTTNCAHSNYISRNRSTGQISNYLPSDPSTRNDELIFIQAGPGTYATINIDSGLNNFRNCIVHRAELLMNQAEDASDLYLTPPNLFLLAKDDTSRFVIPGSDTNNISTADAIFSSAYLANYTDFGGVPKKNITNGSLYSFNLSRYIQGVVTKDNRLRTFVLYAPYNEPFKLFETLPYTTSRGYVSNSPTNTAGSGRVRLYGGDGDGTGNMQRMRLHIVYSESH
jgi:hypothetical protein